MSRISRKLLYWIPRSLGIAFAVFISVFAFDVFSMNVPFWRQLIGFAIHLIPTYLVIIVLVLAWKWEWVGAVVFIALGLAYDYLMITRTPLPLSAIFITSGPAFLIGLLFLADWLVGRRQRSSA